MDFSDYLLFPQVVDTNHSPTDESFSYRDAFGKGHIADSYTTLSDHSLSSFFDFDSQCDSALSSVEAPSTLSFRLEKRAVLEGILVDETSSLELPCSPEYDRPDCFGYLEEIPIDFALNTAHGPNNAIESQSLQQSRTPSLCDDDLEGFHQLDPFEFTLRSYSKCESTATGAQTDERTVTKRKPGRPRLNRTHLAGSTGRVPHNQVERKYREGLNIELERLRRAIPTLPQGGGTGQVKPSKVMVLAGAIDYIKKVELERDTYYGDIKRLRKQLRQQIWQPKLRQRV